MRRRQTGRDLGLSVRMAVVGGVLVSLYVAIIAGAAALTISDLQDPRGWLLAPFVAFCLFAFFVSADSFVLGAASARIVDRAEAPELHEVLERLAAQADLPPPKLAIANREAPNSFAVGLRSRSFTIGVTRGLLDRLEPAEVEAVLAHELSHLANRDAVVVTAASFFPIAGAFLGRWRFGGRDYRERKRDFREYLFWPFEMILALTLYLLGSLLTFTVSRYREYIADRGSALLTGAPEQLMSALQKLSSESARVPERDLRALAGLNALFIVSVRRRLLELTTDHPPLEKRLARLEAIAREMGKPAL
jgi:heat shock protein HtpX